MSSRAPLLLVASWLVLPALARAEESQELSPEKVAEIRRDEQQALAKVSEAFGNRRPSEMSSDERREAIAEQREALARVMEKHGVSAKEYARYEARMTPEDNTRATAEAKRLEQAAQAAREQQAPEAGSEEVPVQQGFSDENPVELEVAEGAEPVVDVGLPGEDLAEAVPVESLEADEAQPAATAAPRRSSTKGEKKKAQRQRRSRDDS